MLAEALVWLFTPAAPGARRLGHLAESIAIRARHRRCRAAWAPHLEASRKALLTSALATPSRRTALLLGTGHLLDVPLRELAPLFDSVLLVDVVHPWSSRLYSRRHDNVRLIECDVTGCLAEMPAAPVVPALFLDRADIDWVASINLLSQLGNLAERWLRKHRPDLGEAATARYREAIMVNHLAWLSRFRARTCLLTDLEQIRLDGDGAIIETIDYQPLLTNWRIVSAWRWDIAPPGELGGGETAWHRVAALTQ